MRTALLALALSPTLAVVPCSSDKPDDVDTEGCYGWCSAAFAADHCGWCRCKGCNFCRSSQWKPHQSQAHNNALMADITRAMSGRQKSPSNPPSNPSSFKKLSTTENL